MKDAKAGTGAEVPGHPGLRPRVALRAIRFSGGGHGGPWKPLGRRPRKDACDGPGSLDALRPPAGRLRGLRVRLFWLSFADNRVTGFKKTM